jgi:putative ABC transport system ATP-binding protein
MLIAEKIKKNYEAQEVLRGIDLTITDGEFISIMGESGSGKSTLLSILAGNLRADSGKVLLDGEDLQALTENQLALIRREKLGFVYQNLNLIPTLSARDNILLPCYLAKKDKAIANERLAFLAETLEISGLLNKMPDDMSGGQRQRVAIARGIINSPSILMLDEPTGSLDSRTTEEVLKLLGKINEEQGVTIVQVTHSNEAAAFGTRIIRISDGQVI